MKWINVIKQLDCPDFQLNDAASYRTLMTILLFPIADLAKFPAKFFLSKWKNARGQISFLRFALQSPDIINFSNYAFRKIISFEELTLVSGNSKNILNVFYHQTWNVLDLFELLTGLLGTELMEDSAFLLDLASKQSPELLCLALAHIKSKHPAISDLLMNLTSGFLLGQQNSTIVLSRLWHINNGLVIYCMVDLHHKDPTYLSRLLDVSQELKALTVILNAKPYSFSIDMACLASRREHLNLEKWAQEKVRDDGESFVNSSLLFISNKINLQLQRQEGINAPSFIPISPEVVRIFISALSSATK